MARVFVLGAGASMALNQGAPSMNQLLERVINLLEQDHRNFPPKLLEFIGEFQNNALGQIITFEDLLTHLDFCLVRRWGIYPRYSLQALHEFRTSLVLAICQVLRVDLGNTSNDRLTRKFLRGLNEADTIISFNYDLIIDNSLPRRRQTVNYAIEVRDSIMVQDSNETEVSRHHYSKLSTIPLLKLHGSLNWLHCPKCKAIDVTEGFKGAIYIFSGLRCTCGYNYEEVIVTPTHLKTYRNEFIKTAWNVAREKLLHTDEIVFIGYSMANTDIQVQQLFKHAIFAQRVKMGKKPTLKVVDLGLKNQRRYERLFGQIDAYYANGLKAYLKQESQ